MHGRLNMTKGGFRVEAARAMKLGLLLGNAKFCDSKAMQASTNVSTKLLNSQPNPPDYLDN